MDAAADPPDRIAEILRQILALSGDEKDTAMSEAELNDSQDPGQPKSDAKSAESDLDSNW
jgi:hypothetical protein